MTPELAPPVAVPGVDDDARIRLRAGILSLVVSLILLGAKYQAYRMTGSTAILSDALETIVNVVAALFAIGGLVFAGRPADRNHPYGHGKIEFFSAAFEGGLIAFAAVVIVYEVGRSLLAGPEVRQLGMGGLIILFTGLVNLVLGWYLVRTGRRYRSLTLVADGQHVLADFLTSSGIVVGLGLVYLTGIAWLDVEAHLVVPEFWSVDRAHEVAEDVAARVIQDLGVEGEMVFHTDPCHRIYCAVCDLEDCPIRREPFRKVTPLTLEEAVQPDMPRLVP